MTDEEQLALAKSLYDELQKEPSLGIPDLAGILDVEQADVLLVLDQYHIVEGEPTHAGPGQGGGWVNDEVREQLTQRPQPIFVGYRWPDGSLHEDEPFDINNEEHRASVGLDPAEAHE